VQYRQALIAKAYEHVRAILGEGPPKRHFVCSTRSLERVEHHPTLYRWKKRYAGMGVGELRRIKHLENENHREGWHTRSCGTPRGALRPDAPIAAGRRQSVVTTSDRVPETDGDRRWEHVVSRVSRG
jgi:hypothetical protein